MVLPLLIRNKVVKVFSPYDLHCALSQTQTCILSVPILVEFWPYIFMYHFWPCTSLCTCTCIYFSLVLVPFLYHPYKAVHLQ